MASAKKSAKKALPESKQPAKKAPKKPRKRPEDLTRDTDQEEQERVSRGQFASAFAKWLPADVQPDKGEDFLVRIYEGKKSTGLTFYAQLKSNKDLAAKTTKTKGVSLRLDTKDFPHWKDSNPPVFIFYWDVMKVRGYWVDFPNAMKEVEETTPDWRTQETVTVHLPLEHSTDEAGKKKLRNRVAVLSYPSLSKGKELVTTVTLSFPDTPEGRKELAKVELAIDDGLRCPIPTEHVADLRFSDWHERAFGRPEGPFVLELGERPPADFELPLTIVGTSKSKLVEIPVLLRNTGGGMNREFWDNTHRDDPLTLSMTVDRKTGGKGVQIKTHATIPRRTAESNLQLVQLLICCAQGGNVAIVPKGTKPIGKTKVDFGFDLEKMLGWERFLRELVFVQNIVRRYGTFDLAKGFTSDEMVTVGRLYRLFTTNEWYRRFSVNMGLTDPIKPDSIEKTAPDRRGALSFHGRRMGQFEVLGVKIPIGEFEAELLDHEAGKKAIREAVESGEPVLNVGDAQWVFRIKYDPLTPPPDLLPEDEITSNVIDDDDDEEADSSEE